MPYRHHLKGRKKLSLYRIFLDIIVVLIKVTDKSTYAAMNMQAVPTSCNFALWTDMKERNLSM